MLKVLKVYLKNSKQLQNDEIYCIRLSFNEELETLKNKVFLRCPLLQNEDPQIYWFDLENDKIRITCDDDLKFFMEESACHKVIFDFRPETEQELSRKRSLSQIYDESIESSKRIRKQFENIVLSSDSSSMETDDDDDDDLSFVGNVSSVTNSKNSSSNNIPEQDLFDAGPSTSAGRKSPNVNIISVDIIKPLSEDENINKNENEIQIIDDESIKETSQSIDASGEEVVTVQDENLTAKSNETLTIDLRGSSDKKEQTETNRIVISDSSDDETESNNNEKDQRNPQGPSASASSYSFTNVNGEGFESQSFSGNSNGQHHSHSFRRHWRPNTHHRAHSFNEQRRHHFDEQRQQFSEQRRQFEEQMRNMNRTNTENMERIQQHARMAREHAARAIRASTSAIPDLVSSFQAHFRRPLFSVSDLNQQIFGNLHRR
ncbi:CLUMA_CG004681, isoform A [Clunio marinus]|uniref:CLUMA_CG004681, isoform A n=1 Tax=Clunio marinus TaxID=568069 RepID=A0A1J1HXW9_9DIPT|nr:CLUMA_CG004681, isoform A [Clunio marinus]